MKSKEGVIEAELVKLCKGVGWLCIKLVDYVGIPDRIVITTNGVVCFVECKVRKGKLSPAQIAWRDNILAKMLGVYYQDVYSVKDVSKIIGLLLLEDQKRCSRR